MDYLIDNKGGIEKRFFDQMRDLFNMSVDVVLFDTTTIVYYGEGGEQEEERCLLKHGFSKAKRGDLKQVVLGVIMSKDGVPLGHEVFAHLRSLNFKSNPSPFISEPNSSQEQCNQSRHWRCALQLEFFFQTRLDNCSSK